MHGAHEQVSRQAGLDGDSSGFGVSNLADHENLGVLSQQRSQRRRKRHLSVWSNRHLGRSVDADLHGIFQGYDALAWQCTNDMAQNRGQRRALAAPGRSGQEQNALILGSDGSQGSFDTGCQTKLAQIEQPLLLVEEPSTNPEFRFFLKDCRESLEKIIMGTEKGYNLRSTE